MVIFNIRQIGISVFIPPFKEDYTKYKESLEREEKAHTKYQKKRQSRRGPQLPVRTVEVDSTFHENVCSPYYFDVNFLTLIATCTLLVFIIVQIAHAFNHQIITNENILFVLEFFTIILTLFYLIKFSINGLWRSGDLGFSIVFGLISWLISFVLLYLTPEYVDFYFADSFQIFSLRVKELLNALNINATPTYEYFCGFIATISFLLTVSHTKCAENFARYYSSQIREDVEKSWASAGYSISKFRRIKVFLHIAFALPLLFAMFYIPALLKNIDRKSVV